MVAAGADAVGALSAAVQASATWRRAQESVAMVARSVAAAAGSGQATGAAA
jgi:hypothetical protein